MIDSIGENDQCFAALLLAHELVRSEGNRVVKMRATAAPPAATTAPSSTARIAAASATCTTGPSSARTELRRLQGLQRGLKLGADIGEVLQKGYIEVEIHDKRQILLFAQQIVQKTVAGASSRIQNAPLAEAGIDKQSQAQRQIAFFGEIVDVLRAAIFRQSEGVLVEVRDDLAVLVADGGDDVDGFHVDRDFWFLLAVGVAAQKREKRETGKREEPDETSGWGQVVF